jgi:hypothetical protein
MQKKYAKFVLSREYAICSQKYAKYVIKYAKYVIKYAKYAKYVIQKIYAEYALPTLLMVYPSLRIRVGLRLGPLG